MSTLHELIAVVTGTLYLILWNFYDSFGVEFFVCIKSSPAIVLSHGVEDIILRMGLFLCACGDAFLEVDDSQGSDTLYFYMGLLSFLSAHLLFAHYFNSFHADKSTVKIDTWFKVFVGALLSAVLYPCVSTVLRFQGDTVLAVLICIYGAVIASMALASFKAFKAFPKNCTTALAGSLIFVLSDSVLALDKFWRDIKFSKYIILGTYYLALLLISRCNRPSIKSE